MEPLPPSIRRFESIEQLDELPRELGWPLEYRQIEPGSFSSTFADLDGDSWFLMEEQSSRTVEVAAGAPAGMYMLALAEGPPAVINGQSLTSGYVLVESPDAELQALLPAGIKCTQVGILSEEFEDIILSIAPDLLVPREGIAMFAAEPGRLDGVRSAMRTALLTPSISEATRDEAASKILTDIVTVAFDQDKTPSGRDLHRAAARRSLNKAREYIEAHLDSAIKFPSLCSYAGTTLRTLERIFARELGQSPQQYVKARRLNAVRRRLLTAERGQGRGVTYEAQAHGFNHMGRFSVEYRRFFGESPRETLRSQ